MPSYRFSYRPRLYRKAVVCVIFAAAAMLLPAFGQYARRRQVSKGPRAVGLLQLAANGKAHLIPITIMIDGKFYDASAYKADPVPMALQSGTVYEAEESGESQGLFTVSGAMPGKDSWVGDGKWKTEAEIAADKARVRAQRAKLAQKAPEDVGGPPRLKRAPNSSSDESPSVPAVQPAPPSKGGKGTSSSPSTPQSAPTVASSGSTSDESSNYVDTPDRPILRREPAAGSEQEQQKKSGDEQPLTGPIQLIPAVSDAGGPDPRPYTFETKPEEQQNFLKKMLAMASDDVHARAEHLLSETETSSKPSTRHASAVPAPELRDVQLHIFDLTNSNEPVLVLNANASIPNGRLNLQYSIALVAREDIYGELHRVFSQTTDNQHLDVLPKYEFIDAVDADGDGRGELLFRTTSDSGVAYSIYAVIGDRLWPLFEGKAGA